MKNLSLFLVALSVVAGVSAYAQNMTNSMSSNTGSANGMSSNSSSSSANQTMQINNSNPNRPMMSGMGAAAGSMNSNRPVNNGIKTLEQRRQEKMMHDQQIMNRNTNNNSVRIQQIPNNNSVQQINNGVMQNNNRDANGLQRSGNPMPMNNIPATTH